MKNVTRGLLLLGAFAISACSSGSSGGSGGDGGSGGGGGSTTPHAVEKDGTCSNGTMGLLLSINDNLKIYAQTEDQNYLLSAQKSCKDFQSLIGEQSCKGIHPSTKAEIHVSKDTPKTSCNAVENILNPGSADGTPISVEPGAEVTDESTIGEIQKGLSLKIKDATTFNMLFSPEFILEDGKSILVADQNGTSGQCKLKKTEDFAEVRESDSIEISSLYVNLNDKRMMSGSNKDRSFTFICVLLQEGAQWKLKDLKTAFGELAEIQVKK